MPNFKRKLNRISKYDYSQIGYYFITICTYEKKHFFGSINSEKMDMSKYGVIAEIKLKQASKVYDCISLIDYVIMPNHIHFILAIEENKIVNISRIVKGYKEAVTKDVGFKIWQKSFYDHVIRNEADYLRIRQYIDENILKWNLDEYNENGPQCGPLRRINKEM